MRSAIFALAAAFALGACQTTPRVDVDAAIAAAVGDPSRPDADKARDIHRKPAEVVKFADVKPGAKVGELIPGGGYFTRILAKSVGPTGKLYAIVSPPQPSQPGAPPPRPQAVVAIAAEPGYSNVSVLTQSYLDLNPPEPLDVIWTSQNYHDLHLKRLNLNVAAVNAQVFKALKPGGIYLVLDHAAEPGSGLRDPDTLHRIDPAQVRREVEAAGFVFVSESPVLRNPGDDHAKSVFDPGLRGETDQFVFKFKKPK